MDHTMFFSDKVKALAVAGSGFGLPNLHIINLQCSTHQLHTSALPFKELLYSRKKMGQIIC